MEQEQKKERFTSEAMPGVDDNTLVERCKNGDSAAVEALIIRYQDRLYNTILRICQNPDDAAELLGDTFVKILDRIGDFQSRSSFYTWAFSIAVNLTISHCRRKQKIKFSSIDQQQEDAGVDALKEYLSDKSEADPAAISQNAELCSLVNKLLAELSDEHRSVLVLRDIEGMDYEHISRTLNISVGTVKSRLNRARNNLRELLESYLDEK